MQQRKAQNEMASQVNPTRHSQITNPLPTLAQKRRHFLTHSAQRHHTKKLTDPCIPYEYRCKNPQQNTSNPNAARCERAGYRDKWIYCRNAELIQHMKINVIYYTDEEQNHKIV